jgi:hypothetical protein
MRKVFLNPQKSILELSKLIHREYLAFLGAQERTSCEYPGTLALDHVKTYTKELRNICIFYYWLEALTFP